MDREIEKVMYQLILDNLLSNYLEYFNDAIRTIQREYLLELSDEQELELYDKIYGKIFKPYKP